MKYKVNTINAVEQITSFIMKPICNRKVIFLFGAGINYNITKKALNWNDLSSDVMEQFLREKYDKFAAELISRTLVNSISNNKVSLSFSPLNLKDKLIPHSDDDNRWFINGYEHLMDKFEGKVEIFTLNYDLVLEKVLKRKSTNFITSWDANTRNRIVHLHGVIDNDGKVPNDSLLTLENYVNNAKCVEENLIKHFNKENLIRKDIYEAVIIIGTTLQEEHLLRAFNRFEKEDKYRKIFLVDHLPKKKALLEKMNNIYESLHINILNINSSGKYNEDFKDFWLCLTDAIKENKYSGKFGDISDRDDININETYSVIKKHFSKTVNKELDYIFSSINWENTNNKSLTWIILWLEKDRILKKGSFIEFLFEYLSDFPLEELMFLKNERLSKTRLLKVLDKIQMVVPRLEKHDDSYKWNILRFLSNNISEITKENLLDRKDLLRYLINETIWSNGNLSPKFSGTLLKWFSYTEVEDFLPKQIFTNSYPTVDSWIYKLFKNDLQKGRNPLGGNIPKNIENLISFLKSYASKFGMYLFVSLFLFENFKNLIVKNYKLLLLNLVSGEKDRWKLILHTVIYHVMTKNKAHRLAYLREIKAHDCIYDQFPEDIDILNMKEKFTPKMSDLDGKSIKEGMIRIHSWEEVQKEVQNNWVSITTKYAIVNFLRENFNLDTYEKIVSEDKLKDWGVFEELGSIKEACNTWEEYIKFVSVDDKYGVDSFDFPFIVIEPPHEILNRCNMLIDSLDKDFNEKKISELKSIIGVRLLKRHYTADSLWWNKELEVFAKICIDNNDDVSLLNEIFNSVYGWKENHFRDINQKKYIPKSLEEIEFLIRFSENYKGTTIDSLLNLSSDNYANDFPFSLFKIADLNINCQERVEAKYKDYVTLYNYFNRILQEGKSKNIIQRIKAFLRIRILYNYLISDIKAINEEIHFNHVDVFKSLFHIKKIKNKKYSSKIIGLLDRADEALTKSNWSYIIYAIHNLKSSQMGSELKNWLFNKIMIYIDLSYKKKYVMGEEEIRKFVETLDENRQKEFKAAIEKYQRINST